MAPTAHPQSIGALVDTGPGARGDPVARRGKGLEHPILVPRRASYAQQHGDGALEPALCHAPDLLVTAGATRMMTTNGKPVSLAPGAGGILWERAPLAGVSDPLVANLPP
jgi:hypothetical protein